MRIVPPSFLPALTAVAAFASVLAGASHTAAAADQPSADQIVRQMKLALEPQKPSVRTMTMTFDDRGTKTTFGLVQARKRLPDGNRSLTVLLEPEDARGIAYLTSQPAQGEAVEWLYVPVVRRTRKLVPAENYQSFLDTDFTYGDLGLLPIDTANKLLGTEVVEGKKAYKVESIPSSSVKQWYYSRTVTWIDAETLLPIRREFMSPAGDLFKVETFGSVKRVDGMPTPLEIRIENVGTNTSTTLAVDSVTYDAALPDALFAPEKLPEIADADYWKQKPKKAAQGG
jgi:hypothetical protein